MNIVEKLATLVNEANHLKEVIGGCAEAQKIDHDLLISLGKDVGALSDRVRDVENAIKEGRSKAIDVIVNVITAVITAIVTVLITKHMMGA